MGLGKEAGDGKGKAPPVEKMEAGFYPAHPVTVNTRIITFLEGNPNQNLYLPLLSWVGGISKA